MNGSRTSIADDEMRCASEIRPIERCMMDALRTLEEKKRMPVNSIWRGFWAVGLLALFAAGCTPTVQLAPPKEPITINLNVKVQHEIRVRVDKELDELFSKDSPLF